MEITGPSGSLLDGNQQATENRKALDSVTNALEAAKNSALNVANAIATALQPEIERFGQWLSSGAQQLSAFVDKVIAAGGGVTGFMSVMNTESPALATLLRGLGAAAGFLKDGLDVVTYGFHKLAAAAAVLYAWVEDKVGKLIPAGVKGAVVDFGEGVAKGWRMLVGEAHDPAGRSFGGVLLTPEAKARIAAGEAGNGGSSGAGTSGGTVGSSAGASAAAPTGAAAGRPAARPTRDDVIRHLIGMGLTVDQAAAMAANIQGESNFDPTAINKSSGAAGLMQYLSKDRVADFQRRYGTTPDKAPWQTQLNFLRESPAEWSRLQRSMSGGKSAADYGAGISRVFEAHGIVAEDARRAQLAAQYAREFKSGGGTAGAAGGASPTIGQQINVQNVTVQANNAQEFATSVSRVGGATNYNSATR
ncbi:phage tail tip lysozyme [Variovorax gossypii]